jgi:acyl dehydratase
MVFRVRLQLSAGMAVSYKRTFTIDDVRLAQEMTYRFHRPVFTGDDILCDCRAAKVEDRGDRTYVEFDIRCTNQHGKEVVTGSTKGVILRR